MKIQDLLLWENIRHWALVAMVLYGVLLAALVGLAILVYTLTWTWWVMIHVLGPVLPSGLQILP